MVTRSSPQAAPGQDSAWLACRSYSWMTPQAWSCLQPHQDRLRQWLVQSAGDPQHGRLLLHVLHHRLFPVVEALLAAGANPCVQPYGPSETSAFMPLVYAVGASEFSYQPAIVDLLLSHGADPLEPVESGLVSGRCVMSAAIDDPVALADLLRRGWCPDMLPVFVPGSEAKSMLETPLQYAVQGIFDKHTPSYRRRQVVRILLMAGADIEKTNVFGQTPLLLAIVHQPHLVPLLLRHGADIRSVDNKGLGVDASIGQVARHINPKLAASLQRRRAQMEEQWLDQSTTVAPGRILPPRL